MAITLVHILYHPGILGLVPNGSSHIGVDYNVPTKVSSTDNAESLVFASLETILVELSFLSQVD